HVDAHAAHAERVQALELRIRDVLVDVHDTAAELRPDLAHRVEHAAVVAPVGARLHEHEALYAELRGELAHLREWRERRLVAQVRAVGIALLRAEYVEMGV